MSLSTMMALKSVWADNLHFLTRYQVAVAVFLCDCTKLQRFKASVWFAHTEARSRLPRDQVWKHALSLFCRGESGYRLRGIYVCVYRLSSCNGGATPSRYQLH